MGVMARSDHVFTCFPRLLHMNFRSILLFCVLGVLCTLPSTVGTLGSRVRATGRGKAPTDAPGSRKREAIKGIFASIGTLGLSSLINTQKPARGYPLPQPPPITENINPKKSELDSFFDTAMELQQNLRERESLQKIRSALPENIINREKELVKLRIKTEAEAKQTLGALQKDYESGAKLTQEGKLCATPFGVDVVGITELVALTGALVSGITSRRRKEELKKVNEQLRKINLALRKQARIGGSQNPSVSSGILFNPDLNYAYPTPPSGEQSDGTARVSERTRELKPELSESERQCIIALKEGKKLLKTQVRSASVRFKKALMIAKKLRDTDLERKAARGLGACYQRQFMYEDAIRFYLRAVQLTESRGDALEYDMRDLYNSIADVYADMGDVDKALEFYDRYLRTIGNDPANDSGSDEDDAEGNVPSPGPAA
ncbi:hypothetical protein AAMO2058_001071200 [Amorphochlora amoebiformis]